MKSKHGQAVYLTVMGDPDHQYDAVLKSIEPAPESIVNDSSLTASCIRRLCQYLIRRHLLQWRIQHREPRWRITAPI